MAKIQTIIKNHHILLFLTTLLIAFISIWEKNVSIVVMFMLFTFLSVSLIKIFVSKENQKLYLFLFSLFLLIFIAHAIFLHFGSLYYHGEAVGIVPDEITFYKESNLMSQDWLSGGVSVRQIHFETWYKYVIGAISFLSNKIAESNPFNLRMLSSFFGAMIPLLVYYLTMILSFNKKIAKRACLLTGFFPIIIFYSGLIERQIIVTFFTLLIFILIVQPKKNIFKNIVNFSLLLLSLLTIYFLRNESGIFMFALILIFYFYKNFSILKKSRKFKFILVLQLMIIIAFIAGIGFFNHQQIKKKTIGWYSNKYQGYIVYEKAKSKSNSLAIQLKELPFPVNIISQATVGIIAPFPPWSGLFNQEIKRFPDYNTHFYPIYLPALFITIGSLIWYFLIPFYLIGIYKFKKYNINTKICMFGSLFIIIASMIITLDLRHKLPAIPIVLSIATIVSSDLGARKNKKIKFLTILFVAGLIFLYLILKYNLI